MFYSSQEEVDKEVATLLSLKNEYKKLTGEDLAGGGKREKKGNKENKPEQKKQNAPKAEKKDEESSKEVKKQTR